MRRRRLKARVYFTFRVPFRLAHSRRVRAAFKVYSAAEECGRTSSTHAQDHQLDLRGLIKLPALGRGVRLYASPLDDENYIYRGLARIWPVCRKPHQTWPAGRLRSRELEDTCTNADGWHENKWLQIGDVVFGFPTRSIVDTVVTATVTALIGTTPICIMNW